MIHIYRPTNSRLWKKRRPLKDISEVVVHHSAHKFYPGGKTSTMIEIDRIARSHMKKDWGGGSTAPNIAYHFAIDPIGRIFLLNYLDEITWHAQEANDYSIGVLVLGNYEIQNPSILVKRALVRLAHSLNVFLNIQNYEWTWHDEAQKAPTLCCGKNLIPVIQKLQKII